jgi:hypothetical protein
VKLAWFTGVVGDENLLQPNRFETAHRAPALKVYVDGNIRPQATVRFQNVNEQPELTGKIMETPVRFNRALNPHSGCYFLNAAQMERWTRQQYFLDRDTSFIGPLESAATLGIMRAFRVYKPAPENAGFLEIQHFGTGFLSHIGQAIPFGPEFNQPAPPLAASQALPTIPPPGVAAWNQVEGFFSVREALAVQEAVKQLPAGAVVAELGSFRGRSAVAIASVLPAGGVLHCVDTFEGALLKPGEARPPMEEVVRRNREAFERNIATFGLQDRIRLHAITTTAAAQAIAAESLDLLFIDAGHQYEDVREDLANWYPKLKPGGWLFCDDYESQWPGVIQAVRETGFAGDMAAPSLWRHRKPTA